jgi:CheY-like chemotaxis protein
MRPRASSDEIDARSDVAVLIVDDDRDIRDTLQELLEYEGYDVATAENGVVALARLQDFRPKLILLDLTMPVMDGATFRDVQMSDESFAAIPTIVMTARGNPGRDAGPMFVRGCLAKPIELEELLKLVEHYCGDESEKREAGARAPKVQ